MSAAPPRALTDLERRVALLVAWGGSNREVAEALGIDTKDVERTLRRIYRNLGDCRPTAHGSRCARLDHDRIVEALE
jgi:DNA-binding NarL/FixJ family response regulator